MTHFTTKKSGETQQKFAINSRAWITVNATPAIAWRMRVTILDHRIDYGTERTCVQPVEGGGAAAWVNTNRLHLN